jgi:hypothetical protein
MSDKKISELPASTVPVGNASLLSVVQSGVTKKVSVADVLAGATVSSGFSATITDGTVYVGAASSFGQLAVMRNGSGTTTVGASNSSTATNAGVQFATYFQNTEIGSFRHYWNGGQFINRIKYFGVQEFADSSTVRVRFEETTGNITAVTGNFKVGTAGKGIDFSADGQAAGMTSELLDDYEEGTFTPVVAGTTTAGSGTYTTQVGSYTKIGRQVSFALTLAWSAHTGTGNMLVSGLPFVPSASLGRYAFAITTHSFSFSNQLAVQLAANASNLFPVTIGDGIPTGLVPIDAAVAEFVVSGTYFI